MPLLSTNTKVWLHGLVAAFRSLRVANESIAQEHPQDAVYLKQWEARASA